ncbi:MAG: glycosyltransferase [Bacteroidota bacterium]|nr:glycosyltransferase [Bacteroidota bacterium]
MDPAMGGPSQGIRNSIPELEKLNIYREVVSLDAPGSAFIGKDHFLIHPLGPCKTSWCFSPKLLPWLILNLERFDIVILNGLWQYHGFALCKALKLLSNKRIGKQTKSIPKYFVMPHGMLDPYFQKASHRKLKAIRNLFYWKLIERRVVNNAEGLLFTCEAELLLARNTFPNYHPKKEINVGYGIANPPNYSAEMLDAFITKCPEVKNKNYLLFLSRIHDKKGVDILVKAYLALEAEFEHANKKTNTALPILVIAGPGLETKFGKKLKELVNSSNAKDKIVFTGMLTGNAKWGAFYGCEAFILPSHQENFGIAVVEALACKKPVLISVEVNIWREIKEAGAGIIEKDTFDGTCKMLVEWGLLSSVEKTQMAEMAYKTYYKHFHIATAALKFKNAILKN